MVTDKLLHRIRAHLASPGITKAGLAKAAGLHPNTLRDADREDWNPTSATLRAVEPLLPAEDAIDWPLPSATKSTEIIRSPEARDGEGGHGHPFSPTSSNMSNLNPAGAGEAAPASSIPVSSRTGAPGQEPEADAA